jgi:predicted short-subunit dehydrogenase-like oxidoreductase (DUF2520 family)
MKAKRVTGLVGAGGVSRSFMARMPALLADLGPVKAASYRVARRLVNSLRAGYAVPDYGALGTCDLIWLAVPDALLDPILRDLAVQAPLDGTMVVLCGSTRDSLWPSTLGKGHARVASLNIIEESGERAFVAEGHSDVLRELRRLTSVERRKLIEIRPAGKGLYFAGVNLATSLILPWIAAAVDSLRAAGFSRSDATRVAQTLASHSLRSYARAGRRAWSPRVAPELRRSAERDLASIQSAAPLLAALYGKGIEHALGYFESGKRGVGSG